MWLIVIIILVIVFSYALFSKGADKIVNNEIDNFEQNKWWIIGAIAAIHNKRNYKK